MKSLVIVESPTKAKTITKFLPDDYIVQSSYGHVRDLPKSKLGVEVEKDFEPSYVIPTKAKKNLTALKKAVKVSEDVILATDEDREGEAISWHLAETLGLSQPKRIVFHEITKAAILAALANPRSINMDLVNAQQARRVLDRLVGYKLSPFLWKKVMRGLSAGRVQSVALRLIVDREKEIKAFIKEEYWTIEALLLAPKSALPFQAVLYSKEGKALPKFAIPNETEAKKITEDLKNASFYIENIEKHAQKRNPLPPFTTSTVQQAASSRLGYSAKYTMMLAQNLYERGLITYHRTDSLTLAESALSAAKNYIESAFGEKYWAGKERRFKTKTRGAQEAHEAIRPAFPDTLKSLAEREPQRLKLEPPQKRLYELIWQRFIASQMAPALFDGTTVSIGTKTPYGFRANGFTLVFDGFLKVYPIKTAENELPSLQSGENLELKELQNLQHFTEPPARYNEASLIKILEQHGIGRPSTYASIISTIEERNYVIKNEAKRFEPSEIGIMVNDLMVQHFPQIVDIEFTAHMETKLDDIAEGKEKWQEVIHEFYDPFAKLLEEKYKEVQKTTPIEETDRLCPECGKKIVIRFGRFGKFYACSGFPECKHTEPMAQSNFPDVHCPKCVVGKVVSRRTKRGKIFYGCSKYPECDFASWDKPAMEGEGENLRVRKCPECGNILVEKRNAVACHNKECKYKEKQG